MSVVCCVALRCLLSIPSWALGLAWSYVSSHISTGGGPDLPGHKKVSPFIQSDTGFPAREVFLFTSSYHRHHCNIIISEAGLMWGYVPGLGRIGVTSPPLLASLPAQCLRTHYHCAYEQQYVFYKKLYDVFFCPEMSFCCRDVLSYGLNTQGPLCLWKCFKSCFNSCLSIIHDNFRF